MMYQMDYNLHQMVRGVVMRKTLFIDSDDDRRKMARLVTRLFDLWQLSPNQQANLLGLSGATRSTLQRYRTGEQPLAKSRDLQDRVGHLLGIHKALRILFPKNKSLAYAWPTSKNKAFTNRTPVEVIEEEGFEGLLKVRYYLEGQLQ